MSGFLTNLLQVVRDRRGKDTRFLCHRLLSERGEASQTALAQEIIKTYKGMDSAQRLAFFQMLCREFSPNETVVRRAAAEYEKTPSPKNLAALSAAVEPPRQELIRRINTAPSGTETLVALRGHLLGFLRENKDLRPLDDDLRHLFRSWFNPGFLRLERISWRTSAILLEKLIRYESVHEINGWADLRRRLEADRRCFAFFHPALAEEPIIFVEVALSNGLCGELEPLLDIQAPVGTADKANTAIFYSINNCLDGLRHVPLGNFLIKHVVAELAAEFPNLRNYATLSPLPNFARALKDAQNEEGFTRARLSRLLADFAEDLTAEAKLRDPVRSFFELLESPLSHREVLAAPLQRVALAYLTKARRGERLYDPVATFHLSNGARLERINPFGNLRPYGLEASFGVTVNYRYVLPEVEENHERFVRGRIEVSSNLYREYKAVRAAWETGREKSREETPEEKPGETATGQSSSHAA